MTLKSKVEQLPDSNHLVLPLLGWMQSLRHGPSVACGGVAVGWGAVTSKDGGPSAGAGSWCLGLSTCGDDAHGHQLSRDGGLLSWCREPPPALQPEPRGPWGCWCAAQGGCLPADPGGVLDVTGMTTPAASSVERDPGSSASLFLCHHSRMVAV